MVGLRRNITKECMVDVTHGLLLVWGEERLSLLHGALSIFPAWLGFDTVLRFCYSLVRLFDSSATENRFYGGNGTSVMVFKENSHHQQTYNITHSIPGSPDTPGLSLFKSRDPGSRKSSGVISPSKQCPQPYSCICNT